MRCEQAQQLFDAYLDGELSVPLATELGTHRLQCPECRRALALLEVSGHIIASDREPVVLKGRFSERLLACVERPVGRWHRQARHGLYIGGPLAAAAVVALAFLGVFDRGDSGFRVAGQIDTGITRSDDGASPAPSPSNVEERSADAAAGPGVSDERVEEWIEQTRKNLDAKRQSGESLQQALNVTITQLLDILEQAKEAPPGEDPLTAPDDAAPLSPPEPAPADNADVEDL